MVRAKVVSVTRWQSKDCSLWRIQGSIY